MRNLKKILALVLALVMSLSLMATAGATQFTDDASIKTEYKTAAEVLDKLGVFVGYDDGTFKPTNTLTRAQAAVLFYRIATGDVEGKSVANYTYMSSNRFTDLTGYDWATPYINYCQNAGIVVGTSATTFAPGRFVTGYQLLIMMLRTLGYDKNGEFSGSSWELTSASKARELGMLQNVTDGDLGATKTQGASREMTAEILFRGILQETVKYSPLTPGGYTKDATTLGYQTLSLEAIEGVVVANEWANLDGASVLADNTTRMLTSEGKVVVLDEETDLDAVGQTHVAYIDDKGENGNQRAITLELSGNNVAFNEGKATSVKDLAKEGGLSYADADYYVNYKENWNDEATSDILVRYVVTQTSLVDHDNWTAYLTNSNNKKKGHTIDFSTNTVTNENEYVVSISPENAITTTDLEIMKEIFYTANRLFRDPDTNKIRDGYVEGEVYVGTSSLNDVSDEMSWKKFEETYLDYGRVSTYEGAGMGESLRIIDNNGDGKAEYVFKIEYVQDKVVATYKEDLVLNSIKLADYSGNNLYNPDNIAVNDIVNYDIIDGKLSIWKADVVNGTIDVKNFKDVTVTVKGGDTYDQSEIKNETNLDENIMLMADDLTYNMYLDEFGNIRTYERATAPKYGLLTEIYPTTTQNWNYVKENKYWAELTHVNEDDPDKWTTDEYITDDDTVFRSNYAWSQRLVKESNVKLSGDYNYLQPAIAHLGFNITNNDDTLLGRASTESTANEAWNRDMFWMYSYNVQGTAAPWDEFYGAFGYDSLGTVTVEYSNGRPDETFNAAEASFTNVALYTFKEDGSVNLETASERYIDKYGNYWFYGQDVTGKLTKKTAEEWVKYIDDNAEGYTLAGMAGMTAYTSTRDITEANGFYYVYAVDYVQLVNNDIDQINRHYTIDPNYRTFYNTNSNGYVDALDTTEFFIVYPDTVKRVVGYKNLPKIDGSTIRATYAVAQNTQSDDRDQDYWTADVIVIEVEKDLNTHSNNVALMYFNPYEKSGNVRYLNSLDSRWSSLDAADPDITIVPKDGTKANYEWGNHSWTDDDYGFYDVYPATDDEGNALYDANADELTVTSSVWIPHNSSGYEAHNIKAGIITRMDRVTDSHYIDVEYMDNGSVVKTTIDTQWTNDDKETVGVPFYKLVQSGGETSAVEMLVLSDQVASDVKKGDCIIWVGNDHSAAYVVDVGAWDVIANVPMPIETLSAVDVDKTPSWLIDLWMDIAEEWNEGLVIGSAAWVFAQARSLLADLDDGMINPSTIENDIRSMISRLKALNDLTDAEKATANNLIARLEAALTEFGYSAEYAALKAKVLAALEVFAEKHDIDVDSEEYTTFVTDYVDTLTLAGLQGMLEDDGTINENEPGIIILLASVAASKAPATTWPADTLKDGVITLTKDLELTEVVRLDASVKEVNLNGHTVTFPSTTNGFRIPEGANVTFTNGTIELKGDDYADGKLAVYIPDGVNTATVTIGADVTVKVPMTPQQGSTTSGAYAVYVGRTQNGVVNVYGKLYGFNGIGMQGAVGTKKTVNVYEGAEIEATDWAIYAGGGNHEVLNVYGGTIGGQAGGIDVCGGTAKIEGGEIGIGTVASVGGARPDGGGSYASGAAIGVTPYDSRKTDVTIGNDVKLVGTTKLLVDIKEAVSKYDGFTVRVSYPTALITGTAIDFGTKGNGIWDIYSDGPMGLVVLTLKASADID